MGNHRGLAVSRARICPVSNWTLLNRCYFVSPHTRLAPIHEAPETVCRPTDNILTGYHHSKTTGMNEGLTCQIRKIERLAAGFRNKENVKTTIYARSGGLDLPHS